jgi:hypothetical protein
MAAARPLYVRLPAPSRKSLFERIIARCERGAPLGATGLGGVHAASGAAPVVVFDLDGTLLDNRPRTLAIFRELADEWARSEPDIAVRLKEANPSDLAYHVSDSLALLGITREDLVTSAFEFWRARFFADPHLRYDVEVPGSSAFARACYDRGATLVYLTGRDLPLMGVGTFTSLRDLGFPIGVAGTELVLKPRASMPDAEFKAFEAPKLARVGRVVAAFDNEPENCNVFAATYPEADSVFVDTQHLDGAPALSPTVSVIGDFTEG